MSGSTPPDSQPGDDKNPYAPPSEGTTPPARPGAGSPPPAWSGPSGEQSQPERPAPPSPILTAVKLMYVGAALSLLGLIFTLTSVDAARDALEDANPDMTESELDAAVNFFIGFGVAVSLIAVALWLWMAWANKNGRSWARVVATVLGGLNILFTLYSLFQGGVTGIGAVVNVLTIALAAVILWYLYRPESSEYYSAVSRAVH